MAYSPCAGNGTFVESLVAPNLTVKDIQAAVESLKAASFTPKWLMALPEFHQSMGVTPVDIHGGWEPVEPEPEEYQERVFEYLSWCDEYVAQDERWSFMLANSGSCSDGMKFYLYEVRFTLKSGEQVRNRYVLITKQGESRENVHYIPLPRGISREEAIRYVRCTPGYCTPQS